MDDLRTGLKLPITEQGFASFGGPQKYSATLILAPTDMRISANHNEYLGFIYDYQYRRFLEFRPNGGRPVRRVVDLKAVKHIAIDGALVLTAEYHRSLILAGGYRPLIDDEGWPPFIRSLFHELGFYGLVQATGRTGALSAATIDSSLRFVPFVTGTVANGVLAEDLINSLSAVAGSDPESIAIYEALLEAINNAQGHAYPKDVERSVPVERNRWWGGGAYLPQERLLQFVVYDQGVGIPITLKRRPFWEAILKWLPPEFRDDDIIAGAIEFGRTQTGKSERGNGLGTICTIVDQLPGSTVRIVSGKGEILYANGAVRKKKRHPNQFCGTLIQWTLKLPSPAQPVGMAA